MPQTAGNPADMKSAFTTPDALVPTTAEARRFARRAMCGANGSDASLTELLAK